MTDLMKQSAWVNVSFVIVAVVAIGLALAALILALDDDDRVVVGLDRAALAELLTDPSAARPAPATRPAPGNPPRERPPDGGSAPAPDRGPRPDGNQPRPDAAPDGRSASPAPVVGVRVEAGDAGLVVTAVEPGSGADEAGVREGDRLRALNGTPLPDAGAVRAALAAHAPGDTVTLTVERAAETIDLDVTLGAAPGGHARLGDLPFGRFFEGLFEDAQGRFQIPDGLLPDLGDLDVRLLRGPVTAIDDDSITIGDGDPIAIDEDTRWPAGRDLAAGDQAFVVAAGGVARLIVPTPDFPGPGRSPNDA